jgi:hypothetical protein
MQQKSQGAMNITTRFTSLKTRAECCHFCTKRMPPRERQSEYAPKYFSLEDLTYRPVFLCELRPDASDISHD